MRQDYTHITLVVDRSGSMSFTQADAQGGINTLIAEQKQAPGMLLLLCISSILDMSVYLVL